MVRQSYHKNMMV